MIFDRSGRGGIAYYTAHVADLLAELDVDVRVSGVAGQSRSAPDLPGRPWWEAPSEHGFRFYLGQATSLPLSAAAFLRIARAVDPDIVHVQTSVARWLDPAVMRLVRRRCAVVLTVHDPESLDGAGREEQLERRRWRAADGIIVHDRRAAKIVECQARGVPVFVVPVDLLGGLTGLDRRQARDRLAWPTSTPTVLALGLVRPYKGFELLAAAWPKVMERSPHARLVIAGPKTDDVPGVAELERSPGVAVRFGWLTDEEVDLWSAAADLLVLPYSKASHSGVLHRAVANGTPALASAALAEEVERYRAGRVLELEPEIWAQAIVDALGLPLPTPGPSGASPTEGMAPATVGVYREMLRRRSARRARPITQ